MNYANNKHLKRVGKQPLLSIQKNKTAKKKKKSNKISVTPTNLTLYDSGIKAWALLHILVFKFRIT